MNSKTRMLLLITATFALSVVAAVFAQKARQPNEKMWESISERSVDQAEKRLVFPKAYRTVRLEKMALAQLLASAPMEFTRPASENPIIELPMPDGTLARFHFEESPVIEPELAVQHPALKTYRAQGIDDPTASARFDWLPSGFHAIILAASGTVLIDPYAQGNTADYIAYWKKDTAGMEQPFECQLNEPSLPPLSNRGGATPNVISGAQLRTYRLALASTHEYTVAYGSGTISGTLLTEAVIINRINAIYEREVAVHLNIIANNASITYASDQSCGGVPCTDQNDPYTNSDCYLMQGQNQLNVNNVIGPANYDVGHVFSTCNGGYAYVGGVCGSNKANGSTGVANPNDPYSTYYVSHELGHQFGTHHSFNGTCGQWNGATAYEPGSGMTFMSYVGACGGQSLASANDFIDIFTVKGLEDIIGFTQSLDPICGAVTNTGNIPPSVTGPGNFTIPKQTPFSLTGSAVDIDRFTLNWEEYDLGPQATTIPNSDADGNPRPIFRIYRPSAAGGTRIFPSLGYIANYANVPPPCTGGIPPPCTGGNMTGELLPAISRVMVFKMVARDNRANGGGVNSVQSSVTIDGAAAPFAVTSPNTAMIVQGGAFFTVTWVASGNAANVKISLSTDGGKSFPTVLAASTPNDGTQSVLIPNVGVYLARIKVEAVGNIYFDMSDVNFTIITNS